MVGFGLGNQFGREGASSSLARYPSPSVSILGSKVYHPNGSVGGSGNNTFHALGYSEAPFTAVRLGIVNTTTTSYATSAICVAPSAVQNDDINPLNGAGGAQSWTVASNGVISATPAASSANNGVPTISWSDWISVNSIARTDNSAYPHLIMARIYLPSTNVLAAFSPTATESTNYAALSPSGARPQVGYFKSGNFVASNQSGFTTPTKQFFPVIFEFQASVTTKTVLAFGDSIVQGQGSSSHFGSYGQLACNALSTLSAPVQFVNSGFSGMTTVQSFAAADAYINAFAPNVVVIAPYSVNDTASQAQVDYDFTRAMSMATKVRRSGMKPIITTGVCNTSVLQQDNWRKGLNAQLLAQNTFPVADIDGAVSDGASPARLQAGFNSGDGVHPNDAGNAAMQAVLQPLI